jgi:aminoglycoside 2'-N-acetyltransferase I
LQPTIRRLRTEELDASLIKEIRTLLWAAFDSEDEDSRMTEDDWQHALGGIHVLVEVDGRLAAFASVVERELHVDGRPIRTGYVEAVATAPAHQRRGLGTRLMEEVGADIAAEYPLGALATDVHAFYERLGWRTWRGPTSVRTPDGEVRTPEEDGYILVLETPTSPPLDLDAPISCPWRPGDAW